MSTKTFLAITAFTATLGLTTSASAQDPRVASLHEGVQNLETRSKTIRHRAVRASEAARRATNRAVATVDRHRVSITTRLEVLDLLGQSDAEARVVLEIEKTLQTAQGLLREIESWYGIR